MRILQIILQIIDGDVKVLGVLVLRIEHMTRIVHSGQGAAQIHQRLSAMATICSTCPTSLHQGAVVVLLGQGRSKHAGIELILGAKRLTAATLVVQTQSHSRTQWYLRACFIAQLVAGVLESTQPLAGTPGVCLGHGDTGRGRLQGESGG